MHIDKTYWLCLLGVALVVRLVVVFGLLHAMPQSFDAAAYAGDAQAVLDAWPGAVPYYLPPGLPYLLAAAYALFGDTLLTARLFSIAVSVTGVGLAVLLAREVLRARWAVQATGWIAALYPPDVMTNGQVYAQPLEMLCLLAMTYGLLAGFRGHRRWLFALAGLAFGVGSLTRPSLLALTPLLVVAFFAVLRRLRTTEPPSRWFLDGTLLFCLGVVLCTAPVMHINAAHGAGPRLSINNARHFFLGNTPYTPLYKTSYLSSLSEDQLAPEVRAYVNRFGPPDDPDNTMQQATWRYIAGHPGHTLLRTLNRIRAFWGFDYVTSRRIQTYYGLGFVPLGLMLIFEAGGYLLVLALVLLGLCCGGPSLRAGRTWLLWTILFYQLPYMVAFATGTYHFSTVGLLLPIAGAGLFVVKEGVPWRHHPSGRLRFYGSLLLFGLIQLEYAWYTVIYSTLSLN